MGELHFGVPVRWGLTSMRNALVVAAAGAALISGPAVAADFVMAPPPMVAPMPAGFPWAGAYIGTFAEVYRFLPAWGYGMQSGYNFVRGGLLVGVEVETSHLNVLGPIVDASLVGRVGFILRDRILVYGQAGLGALVATPTFNVGGGVEFALRNSLSAFVEAKTSFVIGGPAYWGTEIRAGINYHAGAGTIGGIGGRPGSSPWSGLYLGSVGGYSTVAPALADAGVQVGYNFSRGNLVMGFEAQTTISVAPVPNANLGARVGFGLGERALVYTKVAIGTRIAAAFWSVGGGVEVAMGDRASVFAGTDAAFGIGGGGFLGVRLTGGVNLHFGQ